MTTLSQAEIRDHSSGLFCSPKNEIRRRVSQDQGKASQGREIKVQSHVSSNKQQATKPEARAESSRETGHAQ